MNSKIRIILITISLLLVGCSGQLPFRSTEIATPIPPTNVRGCTAFCLNNAGYGLFGTNLDASMYEGLLFVNKRNVSKTGWEKNTAGEYARWTSRYGSFTFNMVGYQAPWGGMNEAGLMISTLALYENQTPAPDERFPLLSPLWLQYQLDNHSTIEEVLASDSLVRITQDTPQKVDQFLACDRSGDCAVIEFLEGKMVYYTGKTLPVAAITNNVYEESVRAWQEGKLTGDSLIRFGAAADRVTGFQAMKSELAVEYAFDTLKQASHPFLTVWSIVFDPQNLRVYFRTKWNNEIRYVDFGKLDFSCSTPVQMLDIHEKLSGDVSDDLMPYSHEMSFDHLAKAFTKLNITTPRDDLDKGLQELENYPCMDSEENLPREKSFGNENVSSGLSSWVWPAFIALLIIVSLLILYGIRRRVGRN
jgi:penicillin V acylase-like amidase (Ntn superfamily)